MIDDPIVEEVHGVRDKIWDDCGGDWNKLFERWRIMAQSHQDRSVSFEEVHPNPEPSDGIIKHG